MVEQSFHKRSVVGSTPASSMRSHLKDRLFQTTMPCGVIGNTHEFGSCILGSIPNEAVRAFMTLYTNLLPSSNGQGTVLSTPK
jgi:hypothetical protein